MLWNCIGEHLLAPGQEGSDRVLKGREGIELAENEVGVRLNVYFTSFYNQRALMSQLIRVELVNL